jgi:Response regulator containing a CheY-like receiver domain and a GGDEF domain
MNLEKGPPDETYVISCYNCQASFDALASSWCSCLVTKRTVVCSSCLTCFCKAPIAYRQKFWELAPQSMWNRMIAEGATAFELPPNPPPDELPRPLVLVVDDEKDIQRVAVRTIESLGYGVIVAINGMEGLEIARKYHPDLILTDAFMPELDGREMCLRLKTDPETSETKIVIMTGIYTAARYRSEAFREFLADAYLTKPLQFRELQDVLRKHLAPPSHG